MDSNEEKPVAPNSLVKTLAKVSPEGALGLRETGKPDGKGDRSELPPPLTAGKPLPCW